MLTFDKYTASGNDYLVIENFSETVATDTILRLCDRRFGVGADGVLLPTLGSGDTPTSVRIYNSDGSECERSGNGLRILSQWLRDRQYISSETFSVDCLAGRSTVVVESDGRLSLSMGRPIFNPSAVGLADPSTYTLKYQLKTSFGPLDVSSLSLGNPHTVVFTPVPTEDYARLGREIATHPHFTDGTNVQFVRSIDASGINIGIYERGAGPTLASGSSACAAAVATAERNLAKLPMTVSMPGGSMQVGLRDRDVWQTGSAHLVFSGQASHLLLES